MININELYIEELEELLNEMGEKKFHARQIYTWLHREHVDCFEKMTDISKALQAKLKEKCYITKLEIIQTQTSQVDGTKKFLIKLSDGNAIESVFMVYNHGNTLCVSTEVGCKMGCKFCASTKNGFERVLLASEIEGQVAIVEKETGEKISNVVYMGIGEPLDNFENVVRSVKNINNPYGLGIGARHISISTCGLVPEIKKLANENLQATLSISLHAVTDSKRREIMPIANKYSINELLTACKYYIAKTKRRISFEFALIHGINDDQMTAIELAKLLRGMIAHVNLIPVNTIKEGIYTKCTREQAEQFAGALNACGIVATVRRELGSDIDAACGQLRQKYIEKEN